MVVVLIVKVVLIVAALKQKLVTAKYTPLANLNFKFGYCPLYLFSFFYIIHQGLTHPTAAEEREKKDFTWNIVATPSQKKKIKIKK